MSGGGNHAAARELELSLNGMSSERPERARVV